MLTWNMITHNLMLAKGMKRISYRIMVVKLSQISSLLNLMDASVIDRVLSNLSCGTFKKQSKGKDNKQSRAGRSSMRNEDTYYGSSLGITIIQEI
jgi:hypothetical protein